MHEYEENGNGFLAKKSKGLFPTVLLEIEENPTCEIAEELITNFFQKKDK